MKFCGLLVALNVYISFSNADICIDGTSTQNNVYYGNYQKAVDENGNDLLDANGNVYYIRNCDEDDGNDEYLYKRFGKWQTNQVLNGGAYALRCPTASTNPYDCPSGTWENAGTTDSDIAVTNGACAEPNLECDYIVLKNTGNAATSGVAGVYTKVSDDYYQYREDTDKYFQYSVANSYFVVADGDVREQCNGISAYFRSYDSNINSLTNGDTDVSISVDYPDPYSCRTPTISCLSSAPSDDDADLATCTEPCDIDSNDQTISCSYIEISSDDFNSNCLGVYEPVSGEDSVFVNQDSGYYFYYNQYEQLYECGVDNVQSYCQAFVGSNTVGLESTDPGIGDLQDGDSLTVSLTFPASESATIDCLANPPTPPPVSDGDLCLSVNTAYTVNGVKLEDIAGIYEPMTDPNGQGYQAYQLKNCSNGASIEYSSSYNTFIIYSDLLDSTKPYVFKCTTNGVDFTNCDDYTEYNFASYNLFDLQEMSAGDSCSCGQSMTGSNAIQPHGIVKINDYDIIDNNGVVTSIGAWQLFVNALGSETGAIILTIIFLLMLVWTVSMCGYQFGISNKGRTDFKYKPAIAIDDEA